MSFSLYQRDRSPYWWAKVGVLDLTGRVSHYKRVSTKRVKKSEAKRVAAELAKLYADQGQLGDRVNGTIQDAADMYVSELEAQGKPSVKDYRIFSSRFVSISSRLTKQSPIALLNRQFMLDLRRVRISEGYSARYINNELGFWRQVYNKASSDYNLAVTPNVDFDKLKLPTVQKTRYLLDGEEERLLSELSPDRPVVGSDTMRSKMVDQHDLVVILLDTGARLSEITTLTWAAVDYTNWKWINLYRSKVHNESKLSLTSRCQEILQRRWSTGGNYEYVFPSYSGKGSRGPSTKGIRAAIQRAGLNSDSLVDRYGPFTVHSLRHTFASRMAQGNMSLYGVSKLLGHSDTKTTQRYAHLILDDVSDEAKRILESR